MQADFDIGAIAISALTSIISCSVAYGVMKTKITRLEKDIDDHERLDNETHAKLVSKDLFDAVLVQVKDDLTDLKGSMKELLELVHEKRV